MRPEDEGELSLEANIRSSRWASQGIVIRFRCRFRYVFSQHFFQMCLDVFQVSFYLLGNFMSHGSYDRAITKPLAVCSHMMLHMLHKWWFLVFLLWSEFELRNSIRLWVCSDFVNPQDSSVDSCCWFSLLRVQALEPVTVYRWSSEAPLQLEPAPELRLGRWDSQLHRVGTSWDHLRTVQVQCKAKIRSWNSWEWSCDTMRNSVLSFPIDVEQQGLDIFLPCNLARSSAPASEVRPLRDRERTWDLKGPWSHVVTILSLL